MKGATAEPLVSSSSPPKTTIISMIGSSQYFLRARRKSQNSARKTITRSRRALSELLAHRVGRRPGRLAQNPVARSVAIDAKPQRILAAPAHNDSDRRHRDEEQEPEDHRRHDAVEQQPEAEPD